MTPKEGLGPHLRSGPFSLLRVGPVASRRYGFSFIELITMILIIGILALVAIPRLFDRKTFDALRFYDQTQAAVRFAQKIAIAQRSVGGVFVVIGASSMSVCYDLACASRVISPLTNQAMTLSAPSGVSLSAAPASSFSFDALGRMATSTITVSVSAGGEPTRTFSVDTETGYVHP